jgi:hypothetical protein
MADYSGRPELVVGDVAEAGATIREYEVDTGGVTKGQAVYLSANGKIKPTTVAAEIAIGIALQTKAAGLMCPVLTHGKVKVTAGGAITAGGSVRGSTAGKVIANPYAADIAMVDKNLGYRCDTTNTCADGDLILIVVTK